MESRTPRGSRPEAAAVAPGSASVVHIGEEAIADGGAGPGCDGGGVVTDCAPEEGSV